ncbi:limonene-1,2-epoxide hydrolase family protein [Panacagrimonas sp.]|uniref:limonene-1,2-epoxide hydrolase family protein n=1 Tax=Panacagrimonas sp. TaxID=2480088 RepID=UPI003B52A631
MAMSPLETVNAFCAAWQRGDIEELMSYFAEDAIYHNVPVAPIQGKEAIKQGFLAFASLMEGIELIMVRTAATGSVVFNERIDRFTWKGRQLDLPVAGVFEVHNGKITLHRDYFNYPTWLDATGIPLG